MQSTVEELKLKTMVYWKLSRIWNGRVNAPVTISDGIELCNAMMEQTSFTRPIWHAVDRLLQEIITHEPVQYPQAEVVELSAARS